MAETNLEPEALDSPVLSPAVWCPASLLKQHLGITGECPVLRVSVTAHLPLPSWALLNLSLHLCLPHGTWPCPEYQRAQGCGHLQGQEVIKGRRGSTWKPLERTHAGRELPGWCTVPLNGKSGEHHDLFSGLGFQGVSLYFKDYQLC